MDWKKILLEYIRHVGNEEGVDFLPAEFRALTEEESRALHELAEQLRTDAPSGKPGIHAAKVDCDWRVAAKAWLWEHEDHVLDLLVTHPSPERTDPFRSDRYCPEFWRSSDWRWFLVDEVPTGTAGEVRKTYKAAIKAALEETAL